MDAKKGRATGNITSVYFRHGVDYLTTTPLIKDAAQAIDDDGDEDRVLELLKLGLAYERAEATITSDDVGEVHKFVVLAKKHNEFKNNPNSFPGAKGRKKEISPEVLAKLAAIGVPSEAALAALEPKEAARKLKLAKTTVAAQKAFQAEQTQQVQQAQAATTASV